MKTYESMHAICEHTASSKGNLDMHVKRIHHKIKDQKCQFCDYSASAAYHLNIHTKMVHLDKICMKKLSCYVCKFITTTREQLEKQQCFDMLKKVIPQRKKAFTTLHASKILIILIFVYSFLVFTSILLWLFSKIAYEIYK